MPDWIGKTLGKVRIELLLARGGMAEVYLGTHTTLQRPVAVKVLRNQYEDDPDLLDRFQREARVVAMLRHPNIVQVYDFDSVEGHPYIVMEYVPGLALSTYLRSLHERDQKLDLDTTEKLLGGLTQALQYAHDRGVIHRDIKPGNILLSSPSKPVESHNPLPADVQPVLTDFGLVRFMRSDRQTATGQVAGTPAYMSPEQARGEHVDQRTDIYSLGVVLYEILAGRVPFEADSTMGTLMKHINEPPPAVPNLPAGLQIVVSTALAKKASDRFQTPDEFLRSFQSARRDTADKSTILLGGPGSESTQKPSGRKTSQGSWLRLGLVGAGLLLVLGLIALNQPKPPEDHSHEPSAVGGQPASTAEAYDTTKPIGLLRFQDGAAIADKATFTGLKMPAPQAGSQYEVWLIEESGEQRISIGVLKLDSQGKGSISFVDPQGRNLLEIYNKLEVTLEPSPDPSPNPSNTVAFSVTLPPGGLKHVRHLLVSFSAAPNKSGLADGLLRDARLIDDAAQKMLTAYQANDEATTRREAEAILNALVGSKSADHKDWDGDGQVTDPGDGYGVLLNGDNVGYAQAAYSHADYALTAPDATANMKIHGEHVKITAQNVETWAPQLRDLAQTIEASPFDASLEGPIRQAVTLADDILKGTDLNGNEQIEPIPGEGGALTAYNHAYYMADMVIYLK